MRPLTGSKLGGVTVSRTVICQRWHRLSVMMPRRLLKEIGIKSCREVRFSNGGAFFAAANNAAVQVYSSYTAENVGNLRSAS
jgi:hypothetical protein